MVLWETKKNEFLAPGFVYLEELCGRIAIMHMLVLNGHKREEKNQFFNEFVYLELCGWY